jgi:hypothetical protein
MRKKRTPRHDYHMKNHAGEDTLVLSGDVLSIYSICGFLKKVNGQKEQISCCNFAKRKPPLCGNRRAALPNKNSKERS